MDWQQQLAVELERRAALLVQEVALWQVETGQDQGGMGIHQSQLRTVALLFEECEHHQATVLAALTGVQGAAFAQKRLELEQELTAMHGIMACFRYALAQREDVRYFRVSLDAADLIAADCYKLCMERAVQWGVIHPDACRVPPLTYLNTLFSPAALTRGHKFGAFRMPLDGYRDLKLPIGMISLPFHHTEALWTFCSIHHEVGHLVDQDLGLREPLRAALEAQMAGNLRVGQWSAWVPEMIADTFGVLLAGAGYLAMMAKLLLLPESQVVTLDPMDPHPTPAVRVALLVDLLRRVAGGAMDSESAMMEQHWQALGYTLPSALSPYIEECAEVAELLLEMPLAVLQGNGLFGFVPQGVIVNDYAKTRSLATYLRIAFRRPDAKGFPARLVPAASQLALAAVTTDPATSYAAIHERALAFIADIRTHLPQWMSADDFSPARQAYLRGLVQQLDFSKIDEERTHV